MRHCNFFRLEETTFAQRAEVMTGFIRRVRELAFAVPGLIAWEYIEGRQILNCRAVANSGSVKAPRSTA